MKCRVAALLLMLLMLLPVTAFAHGGGLDANGCHTNRKTGDYHCHRASPPPSSSGSMAKPRASSTPVPATPLYSQPQTNTASAVQCPATERQLVLAAQLLLLALGYSPGKANGLLYGATTTAVKQFQMDRSLDPDGLVNGSLLVRLAEQVAIQGKAL